MSGMSSMSGIQITSQAIRGDRDIPGDKRIPVYVNPRTGEAYTLFDGVRRPWGTEARFTVSGDDGSYDIDESTTKHSNAFYERRFIFNAQRVEKKIRANLPRSEDPLIMNNQGYLVSPLGRDVRLPSQRAARDAVIFEKDYAGGQMRPSRPSDRWLNPVGSYPTAFQDLLPQLQKLNPKLNNNELFEKYASIRDSGLSEPTDIVDAWLPPDSVEPEKGYEEFSTDIMFFFPDLRGDDMDTERKRRDLYNQALAQGIDINNVGDLTSFFESRLAERGGDPVSTEPEVPSPADTTTGNQGSLENFFPELTSRQVYDLYREGLAAGVVGQNDMVAYIRQASGELAPTEDTNVVEVGSDGGITPVVDDDNTPYAELRDIFDSRTPVSLSNEDLRNMWNTYKNETPSEMSDEDLLHFLETSLETPDDTTTTTIPDDTTTTTIPDDTTTTTIPDDTTTATIPDDIGTALVPFTPTPVEDDLYHLNRPEIRDGVVPATISPTTTTTTTGIAPPLSPGDIVVIARF